MVGNMNNICNEIAGIVPKNLSEIHTLTEKLETINVHAKFLFRDTVNNQSYYYYLVSNKYILYLYFRDSQLRYIRVYREIPKQIICEKDLDS